MAGEEGLEFAEDLPESVVTELAWASHLLLTNTVTRSVVAYKQGQVLMRRGVLGPNAEVKPGPILQRVLDKGKAVYLVDLKVYPGRVEFDYLPPNTQGVICQPMGARGGVNSGCQCPPQLYQAG